MGSAADIVPERTTLPAPRAAATGCRAYDLHRHATLTVFGEGGRAPGSRWSILRSRTGRERRESFDAFVRDLRIVARDGRSRTS